MAFGDMVGCMPGSLHGRTKHLTYWSNVIQHRAMME
jgi:hypothetical protein